MILVGRFLFGVSAGLCMAIHPQYAGEVSPKRLRGFANASVGFFWSLGKSLGQILGLRELLGSEGCWPVLLAFVGVTAFVQLLALPFFPESPPYLLVQKQDEGTCLRAMQRLWGPGAHEEEMAALREEAAAAGKAGGAALGPWRMLKDPVLRPQMRILAAAVLTLQLCGINAVYFYTFEVFRAAGFGEALIPYLSLGIGLCELASALLCVLTIERIGRRALLWGGCGAMAAALGLLALTLSLQKEHRWASHGSLALLFLFVVFFGLGPNGATMSVMMEIFSHSLRPAAFVIGGCLNWAGLFVIGITFPFAVEALGPFCFLIFAVVLVGSGIFFFLFLPETKGKSVAEITEEFNAEATPRKPPLKWRLAAVFRKRFQEDPSVYSSF
ncbi:solute carrier family 2, facilitated glucose transporter member 11-like [Sceloporus undulatus]|uniref:solute carrier family 2, facilitated glucose transporter member 11-like n=1 Tax=Sceloporus undulatus TaxID=8520 RepID=UPI001C4C360E|nr:solute carrier family 2, facilitated glucose transporter member 11-like [Sceloporus undulatus]